MYAAREALKIQQRNGSGLFCFYYRKETKISQIDQQARKRIACDFLRIYKKKGKTANLCQCWDLVSDEEIFL